MVYYDGTLILLAAGTIHTPDRPFPPEQTTTGNAAPPPPPQDEPKQKEIWIVSLLMLQ